MSNKKEDFDLSSLKNIDAQLLYVTQAVSEADWHSTLHTHNNLELFYITSGKGLIFIGQERFHISSGDLIIVNPKTLHTEAPIDNIPLHYIAVGVSNLIFDFNEENNLGQPKNHAIYNMKNHQQVLKYYMDSLIKEVEDKNVEYELVCQSLLQIIITLIKRNSSTALTFAESNNISKECSVAYDYINLNFKNQITLDDLAKVVHMNKFYISHEFKKSYGISPVNYIIKKRIKESKSLLEKTDHSLTQIATIVGFSSPSYFSQIFKKWEHISPSEYRNNILESKKL